MKTLTFTVTLALAITGCGSPSTMNMDLGGGTCDAGGYPCAPYGVAPGSIIQNQTVSGRTYDANGMPMGAVHDLHLAEADFPGKWVIAAIAALGRVAEGEQKTFIGARQILQPQIAIRGKAQWLAREISDRLVRFCRRRWLDQAIQTENVSDARGCRRR